MLLGQKWPEFLLSPRDGLNFIDSNYEENGLKVIQLPKQEDDPSNTDTSGSTPTPSTAGFEFTSFHSPAKNQERLSSTA